MENKDWREQFLKTHYEPQHERGQTCWCIPKTIVTGGIAEIIHNEQRVVLVSLIESLIESILKSKQEEIEKAMENMKKNPKKDIVYCTSYELAIDDLKPIISNLLK